MSMMNTSLVCNCVCHRIKKMVKRNKLLLSASTGYYFLVVGLILCVVGLPAVQFYVYCLHLRCGVELPPLVGGGRRLEWNKLDIVVNTF